MEKDIDLSDDMADNDSLSEVNAEEQGKGKEGEDNDDEDSEIDLFRTATKKPPVTEGVYVN